MLFVRPKSNVFFKHFRLSERFACRRKPKVNPFLQSFRGVLRGVLSFKRYMDKVSEKRFKTNKSFWNFIKPFITNKCMTLATA